MMQQRRWYFNIVLKSAATGLTGNLEHPLAMPNLSKI
jgi:hypothetical protein